MLFYLGVHRPNWLSVVDLPLFISRRRLVDYKTLPRAKGPWALDSGAFTELNLYKGWTITPAEYVSQVRRFQSEVGQMQWAASMDLMCEPWILKKVGGTVLAHQDKTIDNYIELMTLAPDLPWVPVLQGWTLADYLHCVDRYRWRGVNLHFAPVVGLGSVCKRQHTNEIAEIVARIKKDTELRLHGFGVKTKGLSKIGTLLESADSAAWSLNARRMQRPFWKECGLQHKNCANCLRFALHWHARLKEKLGGLLA